MYCVNSKWLSIIIWLLLGGSVMRISMVFDFPLNCGFIKYK